MNHGKYIKKRTAGKYLRLPVLLFAALLLLAGCRETPSVTGSGVFFDTIIRIEIQDSKDQELINRSMDLCRKYENMFSTTVEGSDIYRINHAGGQAVSVSEETVFLLEKAIQYSRLSGGRFDVTIAPASALWQFEDNTEGTIPSESAIAEAVSHIGWENIEIDGTEITMKDPAAQIDLGGIAKGYIADCLKEYLKSNGVEHALINLGGNLLAIGGRADGKAFRIGIQKPFDEQGQPVTSVEITDQSVVSSGIYQRYFKSGGRLYHHILDPETGWPYTNGLLGVTIISDSSADGDALSTSCFALGLNDGMSLIRSLDDGTKAIFITDDYKLHYSWK